MIDIPELQGTSALRGRPSRLLDVACGTGVLLKTLFKLIPAMEGDGTDASADMFAQAHLA